MIEKQRLKKEEFQSILSISWVGFKENQKYSF